jgi:hypothetical protein
MTFGSTARDCRGNGATVVSLHTIWRRAPAEDGRGQPPGWPRRAAHPSRLPQMVHVELNRFAVGHAVHHHPGRNRDFTTA